MSCYTADMFPSDLQFIYIYILASFYLDWFSAPLLGLLCPYPVGYWAQTHGKSGSALF